MLLVSGDGVISASDGLVLGGDGLVAHAPPAAPYGVAGWAGGLRQQGDDRPGDAEEGQGAAQDEQEAARGGGEEGRRG